VRAKDTGC